VRYLILIFLLMASSALIAFENLESASYRGTAAFEQAYPFLELEHGEQYRLLLMPQSLLDSLGINILPGAALEVQGWLKGKQLLVRSIKIEGQSFSLRDPSQKDLYTHHSDRVVNPEACISCWLCIRNCPVKAISRQAGYAAIDPELCIECGICRDGNGRFKGCPVDAID
jgi:ferredoxin